jgi:hypothetical protein
VAYGQKWLRDFSLLLWTALGLTLLALGCAATQPVTGVTCWSTCLGVLCLSLAAHATHRHLFSRSSAWNLPTGKLGRESYRNLARSHA